jgi:GNAT superfamily N-acetyltransferase
MEIPLNFKPAASVSLDELAAAFTAGFRGYFHPMQMTVEVLSRRVRMEQLDLLHSLLADDGEQFVGLALLGLRGREGWCGGFGIVPEFRGRGCAPQLMSEFIARARGCGVNRLRLEVLTRNTPAIRLYERAGMRVTRDLLILERTGSVESAITRSHELNEAEPAEMLRHFERLHAWRPAWQRDFAAMLSADGLHGFCLGERNAPDAYALLVTRPDGVTQVIDLAAAGEAQADALSAVLVRQCGTIRVVNEPEDSLFITALSAHGFAEMERQHEMACELS